MSCREMSEICVGFLQEDKNLFLLNIYIVQILYIDFIPRFSIYLLYPGITHLNFKYANFANNFRPYLPGTIRNRALYIHTYLQTHI